MSFLFIKICIYVISILVLTLCLKVVFNFFTPRLREKKYLNQFKLFIQNNSYDPQTIIRASTCYLPPKIQNTRSSYKNSGIPPKDLTRVLDAFLDPGKRIRHFLILADSGAGKTTFALNYYLHHKNRPESKGYNLVLIPLNKKNADQLILSSPDKKNSALFLDGFDEDPRAGEDPYQRLKQIFNLTASFRKIIITCNINFFPKTRRSNSKKGYEIILPKNKTDDIYELKKVYFSPITLTDAKRFLSANLPFRKKRVKKKIIAHIKSHPAISITPFTLSYFGDIYADDTSLTSRNDVYKAIIQTWIDRERHWEDKALLNKFIRNLATDFFLERFQRGEEAISLDELDSKAKTWGMMLHPFQQTRRSLIRVNKSNMLEFSHRSILEYLFIEQLLSGEASCYKTYLTGNMKKFLFDYFKDIQPLDLSREFSWLSQYPLKAHGIENSTTGENNNNKKGLLHAMLSKENQYSFLARLNPILKNPIFYEFGWEATLNDNLKRAFFQSESSLFYLKKHHWQVLIDSKSIEITKRGQRIQKILFKEKDVSAYNSLETDHVLTALNRSIGLPGLKIVNHINQTGYFTIFPELKSLNKFTIYFKKP